MAATSNTIWPADRDYNGYKQQGLVTGVAGVLGDMYGQVTNPAMVAMHESTLIEMWVNRSYFGKRTRGIRFEGPDEEQDDLGKALNPTGRLVIYDPRPLELGEGATG